MLRFAQRQVRFANVAPPLPRMWEFASKITPAQTYKKIKSFLGSGELSEKASLEKLLFMPLNPYKPTLMFQKKFHCSKFFDLRLGASCGR